MFSENLEIVKSKINNALAMRKESKKTGETVTLVAVTKNHPAEVILASIALGISDIGENRVQEAKQKKTVVTQGSKWHLLGH
ncbi:MAG: YggS family pyridoxal phosphate-dependent enzyme, partial [Acidaminococcaceae bacterium]